MRMWHYKLLPAMTDNQIKGQWRELFTIVGNIRKFGKPNSNILNKVCDYTKEEFINYSLLVYKEGIKRNKRFNLNDLLQRVNALPNSCFKGTKTGLKEYPYTNWMNLRYLNQCYYNMQEKYDCGTYTDEEWDKIVDRTCIYLNIER